MSQSIRLAIPCLVAAFALSVACRQQEKAAPLPAAPAPSASQAAAVERAALQAEAKSVFAERCASCHGVRGAGNGPASRELVPQPRNFQDPGWQSSVTDAYIEQIVLEGGAAVGKSAVMPAQPDLAAKPEVVKALRDYIRSLK